MSQEEVAIDMTYERNVRIVPSEALKKASATTGQPIVCVIVEHKVDTDRSMQYLAIYPVLPRVGEVIVLEDGVTATVMTVMHKIVVRESDDGRYRQSTCYIHCQFID